MTSFLEAWSRLNDDHEFTPKTFADTQATLAHHIASGTESTHWPGEGHQPVVAFQAEHLLAAGYRLVYDPEVAALILSGRKT